MTELVDLLKGGPEPAKWRRRPEVLLHPNIPKPLHGMAPRVVLGNRWWKRTAQRAYQSTDYHCVACGVAKHLAPLQPILDAHEIYRIDYEAGRMYYLEAVPLCRACHNYIHSGRLRALLDQRVITHQRYAFIIAYGDRVLAEAGLEKPEVVVGNEAEWGDWRLVVAGREYRPIHRSYNDWCKAYGVSDAESWDDYTSEEDLGIGHGNDWA